jgi:hypothetical protein
VYKIKEEVDDYSALRTDVAIDGEFTSSFYTHKLLKGKE